MLEMHAQVFRSSREAVMITDLETRILSVNQAFTDITGYSADEVMGQSPRILKSSRHDATFYLQMWRDIKDIGYWQGEIWNRRKNGAIYPQWLGISAVKNSQGQLTGYIGVFMDITDYIQAQQRIEHLAHHDPLTGLPNRILLRDRFEQIRARSQRLDSWQPCYIWTWIISRTSTIPWGIPPAINCCWKRRAAYRFAYVTWILLVESVAMNL